MFVTSGVRNRSHSPEQKPTITYLQGPPIITDQYRDYLSSLFRDYPQLYFNCRFTDLENRLKYLEGKVEYFTTRRIGSLGLRINRLVRRVDCLMKENRAMQEQVEKLKQENELLKEQRYSLKSKRLIIKSSLRPVHFGRRSQPWK